jgi:hypothetical protein
MVLALALGLTGCGGAGPASMPSTPTRIPQSSPQPTAQPGYTLSGVVFIETGLGRVPIEGVEIDEANAHRHTRTTRDGLFSISGLDAASDSVAASRWDVVTYTKTLTIAGDTRLDIELPTYTLDGVVFERTPTGTAPIAGVNVYCDGCGSPEGHTFSLTGANGGYSFSFTYSGTNPLQVWKTGYVDPAGQVPGWRQVMVNGNTRFDIELVRR